MPAAMNMIYCATTCAFWSAGATGVRHVFYRLFSISLGDREDAATNVCRRPAWRLRPAARFLDPAHRHNVLRAISPDAAKTCSGGAGEAYRSYSLTRYPTSLEIARFSISASGHPRTKRHLRALPALPPKADKRDHPRMSALCQSGQMHRSKPRGDPCPWNPRRDRFRGLKCIMQRKPKKVSGSKEKPNETDRFLIGYSCNTGRGCRRHGARI